MMRPAPRSAPTNRYVQSRVSRAGFWPVVPFEISGLAQSLDRFGGMAIGHAHGRPFGTRRGSCCKANHGIYAPTMNSKPPSIVSVEALAEWSPWVRFLDAVAAAPLLPGVYMARQGNAGPIVYVGMAGQRRGRGIRGRLTGYGSGRALASGLGEAVLDRALADPSWLRERLAEIEAGEPMRALAWGRAALVRADLHIRWAIAADRVAARSLESAVLGALREVALWNRSLHAGSH